MADITITIPVDQEQRVQDAFTFALRLETPATIADVKQYIIADLKQFVTEAERAEAAKDHSDGALPPPDISST